MLLNGARSGDLYGRPRIVVMELAIKGHAPATGAPYNQTFVLFLGTEDCKIWRYRECWNPLVTIDALGGRDTWTDGFGAPDPTRDAWGLDVSLVRRSTVDYAAVRNSKS
jgi:hypothetical protein